MPDFDIDQWLAENGYSNPGDISEQGSDYWDGQYDDISGMFTVGGLLTGAGADPVVEQMYMWAQANNGYSDQEFAEQLFVTLFSSASNAAQEEFINTWNNNYADEYHDTNNPAYQITSGGDLSAAAAMWADNYGSSLAGQGFFPSDAMDFDFGSMQGLITGDGGLLSMYNTQWGTEAWDTMYQQASLLDSDYALEAEQMQNQLLEQLEGLEIQAGGAKEQYSLLQADSLSQEQARGVTRTRKGLEGNTTDLGVLSAQLSGIHAQATGAGETTEMNLDILQTEWDNYLANLFEEFSVNSDTAFAELIVDIDDLIDTYNQSVIDETDFQESEIWESLAGILNAGGIIPPTEGGGWENSGMGWMCITSTGDFGVLCGAGYSNEGSCVNTYSECTEAPESDPGGDDDVPPGQEEGQCVYPTACGTYPDCYDCNQPGDTSNSCEDFGLVTCPGGNHCEVSYMDCPQEDDQGDEGPQDDEEEELYDENYDHDGNDDDWYQDQDPNDQQEGDMS